MRGPGIVKYINITDEAILLCEQRKLGLMDVAPVSIQTMRCVRVSFDKHEQSVLQGINDV